MQATAKVGKQIIFEKMVNEFAPNSYVSKNTNLQIGLRGDDDDTDSFESDKPLDFKKAKKSKRSRSKFANKDVDPNNMFTADKNKMDLLLNLNSLKLLEISDQFGQYPDQTVTCDEFIDIMVSALHNSKISEKDDFVSQLVNLFYRCKKSTARTLKFEQLTAYLIEHEIEIAQTGAPTQQDDMKYVESAEVKDRTTHNNNIEKIYYFQQLDKVILYEQTNRMLRIYEAGSMKWLKDIQCIGVILAIEYCHAKQAIAVSLSDRTIVFFDTQGQNMKIVRRLHVPSTQKCLTYIERQNRSILFSAGVDGAIFAWNLDILFSVERSERMQMLEKQDKKSEKELSQRDKEKKEYIQFISEKTPWFVGDIILCIIDLKNINQLASGSYDHKIRLWDLRMGPEKVVKRDDRVKTKKQEQIEKFFGVKDLPEDVVEDFTKKPSKVLVGHQKAVREMAYSEKHKIIVSCGFDFEVFVWNPYLEERIMKLDGHEHPLVGINVLPASNSFISADAKGMVKVWSILDYSCLQTFYVQNVSQVTCIKAVPKHRQLIFGSRQFKVFGYDKPFMHEFSDDNPIICAKFSEARLEIYVAGDRSIKVWDARTGKPVRVMKNVLQSDITCMELDTQHRKLIVGSHQGEVKIFDLLSGINTLSLDQHDPQEGEISFIGYGGEDHTVITAGWDKVIKVHMDEKKDHSLPQERVTTSVMAQAQPRPADIKALIESQLAKPKGNKNKENAQTNRLPQLSRPNSQMQKTARNQDKVDKYHNRDNLLRGRTDAHKNNIICGDFALHLDLIATGGRDNKARIWDYERIMNVAETPDHYHKDEVTIVRFIKPFPLLITTDSNGLLYIWLTKPHPKAGKLIVDWRNNYTLQQNCTITAIDTHYDPLTGQLLMLIGDEMGTVRIQDMSMILTQTQVKIKPCNTADKKRNPYRTGELLQSSAVAQQETSFDDIQAMRTQKEEPVVKESQIIQISQWQAHTDAIRSIQYITCTDEPLVFTASRDKFVKICSIKGEERGTLKQGYLTIPSYKWDFKMERYDTQVVTRIDQVQSMLTNLRQGEGSLKRREKVDAARNEAATAQGYRSQVLSSNQASSSMMASRTSRHKSVMSLLKRGQQQIEVEKFTETLRLQDLKPNTSAGQRRPRPTFQDFQLQQQDMRKWAQAQQDRKIGPFKFDYDDDIESEVLYSEQVYKDLKELDEILGKSRQRGSMTGALGGKKK